MRRLLLPFGLGLLALELVSVVGTAQVVPPHPLTPPPPSLKTVAVPVPEHFGDFVKDKAAAIALGKALFWDTQVASDGRVACATCHFQAGVDVRAVNELNAGANHAFDVGGPNHTYSPGEFPFHQISNPEDRASALVRSKDDVSGSQGVHSARFNDVAVGNLLDDITAGALDPLGFSVDGLNTRRVTG
ncbi:MAG: cytochrome C peroxidase, partial [Deltaproteobacteria bacterium]